MVLSCLTSGRKVAVFLSSFCRRYHAAIGGPMRRNRSNTFYTDGDKTPKARKTSNEIERQAYEGWGEKTNPPAPTPPPLPRP